jgi:hypothetical protein
VAQDGAVADRQHGGEPAALDSQQLLLDDRVNAPVDPVKPALRQPGVPLVLAHAEGRELRPREDPVLASRERRDAGVE